MLGDAGPEWVAAFQALAVSATRWEGYADFTLYGSGRERRVPLDQVQRRGPSGVTGSGGNSHERKGVALRARGRHAPDLSTRGGAPLRWIQYSSHCDARKEGAASLSQRWSKDIAL